MILGVTQSPGDAISGLIHERRSVALTPVWRLM